VQTSERNLLSKELERFAATPLRPPGLLALGIAAAVAACAGWLPDLAAGACALAVLAALCATGATLSDDAVAQKGDGILRRTVDGLLATVLMIGPVVAFYLLSPPCWDLGQVETTSCGSGVFCLIGGEVTLLGGVVLWWPAMGAAMAGLPRGRIMHPGRHIGFWVRGGEGVRYVGGFVFLLFFAVQLLATMSDLLARIGVGWIVLPLLAAAWAYWYLLSTVIARWAFTRWRDAVVERYGLSS